ncbi:hypothetical protein K1719_028838 [Acacia pycnantha]|nr:hypothetical protein K1719_028838 [Acacia pycnantha]
MPSHAESIFVLLPVATTSLPLALPRGDSPSSTFLLSICTARESCERIIVSASLRCPGIDDFSPEGSIYVNPKEPCLLLSLGHHVDLYFPP